MVSNRQFDRARQLASRLAGIEWADRHRELLDRRRQRRGLANDDALDALLDAVEAGEPAAERQFLQLLTTTYTAFFRHPQHFERTGQHALQSAHTRTHASLWCAGTATGEEAFSLAMTLLHASPATPPPFSILATDLDTRALATAQQAEYTDAAIQPIAPTLRHRFLQPASTPGRWTLAPAVRNLVHFQELNLTAPSWPLQGPFDVIFCRNVLMYLESHHRVATLERMANLLHPDGLLLLDPTEHPGAAGRLFQLAGNGVLTLRRPKTP